MSHVVKSLERRFRRAFIRSLRWFPRSPRSTGSILPESPRILVIRHDRIGDAIISTPIFSLLRERFPNSRIDILLGRHNAAVAPLLPCTDTCLILPSTPNGVMGMINHLRKQRYDVAINLLAKDSASGSFLTAVSGAALRIGFAGETAPAYDIAVEKPEQQRHIVSETSLLLTPLGIEPIGVVPVREEEQLHVVIPDSIKASTHKPLQSMWDAMPDASNATGRVIIINISGSGPEKFWGQENYVTIATAIRDYGCLPVFAGSPADAAMVASLAQLSGAATLPATTSYTEFAAMLTAADLIVTPDTSVVHLSAALRKPTLMLVASATDDIPWHPWGTAHRVVRHKSSIQSIPPASVITALKDLLTETIGSVQSSPRP